VTPPRRVLPGTAFFVTRRCSERRFFLRPSRSTNDIFLFVLATAARRYHILVHAFCVLSNHAHLVVTDVEGRLPAFMQFLDSLVARAVNASLGRFEGFWSSDGSYSAIEPLDPSDVLAKCAYALANPVAAGLVKRAAEWPGLWTSPELIGTTRLTARRPQGFFDPKGYLPEAVELELTVPAGFASPEEFRTLLATAVRELEDDHQRKLTSQGRRILGVARVLMQSPFARPAPGEPRFGLKPRIASRDKWKRIEGLFRIKSFEQQYRDSQVSWRSGVRDVVFPSGTYLMRVLHGVQCAGAA
jgi:REP element-mobilizing transposase RayT